MCGVAGIAAPIQREVLERALERMNESLYFRGPDEGGLWAEDGFGFGMRRLSIIDLASGSQPMWHDGSGAGLVYNGETYNYRELRDDLEKDGACFRTCSDTEVVLQTLARKGRDGLHDLNGMFAGALFDARSRKVLLFRDRMGIKPLYYYHDGTTFVFASEIKAIIESDMVPCSIDRQAVWDYLTFRYVPEPRTIWEGIRKLPPGHWLSFDLESGDLEMRPYWTLNPEGASVPELSEEGLRRAEEEFAALFLDSVEKRLMAADVPVGILLSGGLDSSAVAAAAAELGHRNFHSFSVAFEEGGSYSELPFARRLAEHVGSRHHEISIGKKEFMDLLPQMVRAADEPLADLASVPLLAVSHLAREHVKVVLSGEGSDEVLGGYNFEERVKLWERIRLLQRVPGWLRKPMTSLAALVGRGESLERVFNIPLEQWLRHYPTCMTSFWSEADKRALWPSHAGVPSEERVAQLYEVPNSGEPLDQALYVYQRDWMVEDLLMKADKMTMRASLELRVPFLDHRLVEWAGRQPRAVKVGPFGGRKYVTKNVLRRFAASRIPSEIISRPKQGFPVPAYGWLREDRFRDEIRSMLLESPLLCEHFEADVMTSRLADAHGGGGRAAHDVWILVMLAKWHEEFGKHVA